MYYFVKTYWWLRVLFPNLVWKIPEKEKVVYLTFDDGPTPEVTEWVLDLLKQYNAEASFFLIGDNIQKFPEIHQLLEDSPHSIGNHTQHHLNGWKTDDLTYLDDFAEADQLLNTDLFRPPYGRIKRSQARVVGKTHRIIMWDVVSGDFDTGINGEKCTKNVLNNISPGSIIVFHDSFKAFPNLKVALPKVLTWMKENGYVSKKL